MLSADVRGRGLERSEQALQLRRKGRLGSDGRWPRGNNVGPQMASRRMPVRRRNELGGLLRATVFGKGTARMQMTPPRRLDRTGRIARQQLAHPADVGMQ